MRYALREIASGVLPGTEKWVLNARWPSGLTAMKGKYGSMPIEATIPEWSVRHEHAISSIMANMSIEQMAENVSFPDFFYYMGICLHYVANEERRSRRVTLSWVPQILSLFKTALDDETESELRQLLISEDTLSWKHLQKVQDRLSKVVVDDEEEKATPPGVYYVVMKSRLEYNLAGGRGIRWKALAEVLNGALLRQEYPPVLYAYAFLPSAAHLLMKVYNAKFFINYLRSHSYQLMHENIKRTESEENQKLIVNEGFWHDKTLIEKVSNMDGLMRHKTNIENLSVDMGYVVEPAHWKWSSATANDMLTISRPEENNFSDW
jgi:hypothetical protein